MNLENVRYHLCVRDQLRHALPSSPCSPRLCQTLQQRGGENTENPPEILFKENDPQVVVGGCEEVSLTCAGSGMIVVHSATFLPLEGDCEQVTKVFFLVFLSVLRENSL